MYYGYDITRFLGGVVFGIERVLSAALIDVRFGTLALCINTFLQ